MERRRLAFTGREMAAMTTTSERVEVIRMRKLKVHQRGYVRTKPEYAKRALELSRKVAGSFRGTEEVPFPEGFSKSTRTSSSRHASRSL